MNLMGIPIIEHELATSRVEVRVPGGYMNHWLIRSFEQRPCMIYDRMNKRFYVHPSLIPALHRAFQRHSVSGLPWSSFDWKPTP